MCTFPYLIPLYITVSDGVFPNRHQKQALTFMLKRERGWAFEEEGDVWSVRPSHGGTQFKYVLVTSRTV